MSFISRDVECMFNIVGNTGEITGLIAGLPILFLSFIPNACGLKGYSIKLAVLGVVTAAVGLAYPGILNMTVNSLNSAALLNSIFSVLATVIASVFLLVACLAAFFMPTIIALREQRQKKVWMIVCNCLAVIPGPWLIAYIWASLPERQALAVPESPIK